LELQSQRGLECQVYTDLRANPQFTRAAASLPSLNRTASLRQKFDLEKYFAPSSPTAIRQVLGSVGAFEGIVVYDVGQGSSAGIVDDRCRALLYADVGGGVTRNRHTYPRALNRFCSCVTAPIVLSHWDWDHWSSAGLTQNRWLRTHTWIAPMQKAVGPSHLSFAQAIKTLGTLYLWGAGAQPPITFGRLRLERCYRAGRNDSGIALIVEGPEHMNPVLLPGDASYTTVPSGQGTFDSLVVPHHGALMKSRHTPVSPRKAHSRAVYSYGPGNQFSSGRRTISHPALATRMDHQFNGWDDARIVPVSPGQVRQTEDRHPTHLLGHVYLGWSALATVPSMTCACSSDLSPMQT